MAAAIEATKTVIDTLGPSDAIQVRALLRAAPRLERGLAYGSAVCGAYEAEVWVLNNTLGPSDAVQVIDFDSDAVTTTETCMTTMVPATGDNKKKLKAFVGGMNADGSTGFDSLLRAALRLDRDLTCVLLCCGALTQNSGT